LTNFISILLLLLFQERGGLDFPALEELQVLAALNITG
jgi:hypothetical protein